ncbi:hypothetical protein MAPG_10209 [Magnaporthiopsis poae ATCC 64411]|uniref:Uncharacterized protein n=1 Tax=Magnaporthiopsis poae (strain ATCC 64411 / 73-15) TaxID=644358 RepID=A0A0C4EBZ7_MAGP6|nr:hypothetical protein MAPG_10209 [Magnaporthiopsis poae ATCC 64411]
MDNEYTSSPAVLALVDRVIDSYRGLPTRSSIVFYDHAAREPIQRRSYRLELRCGLVLDHRFDFAAKSTKARSVTFFPAGWLRLRDNVNFNFNFNVNVNNTRGNGMTLLLRAELDIHYANAHDINAGSKDDGDGRCPLKLWVHDPAVVAAYPPRGQQLLQQQQETTAMTTTTTTQVEVKREQLDGSFAELLARMDLWACMPTETKKMPVWRLEGILMSFVLFMHPCVASVRAVVNDSTIRDAGKFNHDWGRPDETVVDSLEWLQSALASLPILP